MIPHDLYKAILRSLTQVRDVRAEHFPGTTTLVNDSLIDEMARNSAQAIMGLIEDQLSIERVKAAFWETFHERGEVWFDYLGSDEENERSTHGAWKDFVAQLHPEDCEEPPGVTPNAVTPNAVDPR